MVRGLLPALCAFALVLPWDPPGADACSRSAPPVHSIEPSLASTDTSGPSPPTDIVAVVSRRLGELCDDDGCVSNSCGDTATLALTFNPAIDDQSATEAIGYLLVAESGTLPPSLASLPARPAPNGVLWLEIDFDEAADRRASVRAAWSRGARRASEARPVALSSGARP